MQTTPVSLLERLHSPAQPRAWEEFVELYTPLLFLWSRRLGLQAQDAADLVQDVFALLVQNLPQFRYEPGKSFRAWLKTVFLNKWRNRQAARGPVPLSPDEAARLAAPELPALEEAEYRDYLVGRALQVMQAEFQPVTWQACWQFVVEGRPAAEVAAELGVTPNAVYLAKARVLRRLREELQGLLD